MGNDYKCGILCDDVLWNLFQKNENYIRNISQLEMDALSQNHQNLQISGWQLGCRECVYFERLVASQLAD